MLSASNSWNHGPHASRHRRGYGRQHDRLRARLLGEEPLCRLCRLKTPSRYTPATIADHIIPIAKGGAVHDLSNMQPVCADCHDAKTRADNGWRAGRKRIGDDGWPAD